MIYGEVQASTLWRVIMFFKWNKFKRSIVNSGLDQKTYIIIFIGDQNGKLL